METASYSRPCTGTLKAFGTQTIVRCNRALMKLKFSGEN